MAGLYAEGTTVSVEKSQQEIIQTLRRYGAEGFLFGEDNGFGMLAFRAHGRQVRFLVPLTVDREQYRHTKGYQLRSAAQVNLRVAAEIRRRWRALALAIKAKLEVVESGIADFEGEFLANIVLPDSATVGEFLRPQLDDAYNSGLMPELLPGAGARVLEIER